MRCLGRAWVAAGTACGLLVLPSIAGAGESPVGLLVERLLASTPVQTDLEELSDAIGGRPTGTPALDRAVAWSVSRFEAAGLEDVHTESYLAAGAWIPGAETGEIVAPRVETESENALRVAALPFSSPTPAVGLTADVIDLGTADSAAFAAAGDRVKGRWVLIHTRPMTTLQELFQEYLDTPPALRQSLQHGAAGVLWMSSHAKRLLYRHNATLDGSLFPLPAAIVERDGAERIARLVSAGRSVRVRLRLGGKLVKNAPAKNVVAQVRGRVEPDQAIILGAHLDSWDLGRGALDNGCNVALVIDVARQMMALARHGVRPYRSVRFVLYTGEEAGLFGSWAEVVSHRATLDQVKGQIIFDAGAGRTTGFSLGGREDLRAAVEAALAPARALGPFTHTADAFLGTDNYDYMVEGVPTFVANQDPEPYLPDYHAETDAYDRADLRELRANSAIAAALAWGLAEMPKGPGPRQTHAEVEALTHATGLDAQMRAFDLWDDFVSGARGRRP